METKSRYEVIADLEAQKRQLIKDLSSFSEQIGFKEKNIKLAKRNLEDMEDDLKLFKESLNDRKETINKLIESVDNALNRFNTSDSQKK